MRGTAPVAGAGGRASEVAAGRLTPRAGVSPVPAEGRIARGGDTSVGAGGIASPPEGPERQ